MAGNLAGAGATPADIDTGRAAHQRGDLGGAKAVYESILAQNPRDPEALHLLGVVAFQERKPEESVRLIERAIEINPGNPAYYSNVALTYQALNRWEEAVRRGEQAVALNPEMAEGHNNLGIALKRLNRLEAAEAAFRKALECRPGFAEARTNLGAVLRDLNRADEAMAIYEAVLADAPNHLGARLGVANVHKDRGRIDSAVAQYRRILDATPDAAEVYNNLGLALYHGGRPAEAADALREAVRRKPGYAVAGSGLIFCMNYLPGPDTGEIYRESVRWGERHADPLAAGAEAHVNDRNPDRRLRVGYLSQDLRTHSVAYFLEPLIAAHSREAIEVVLYADVHRPDEVTERFKALADEWCVTVGWSDERLADRIRRDRIDILVDLIGHTGDTRLLTLARKPAPVQVSWLGYPNTTGVKAVDARLTDPVADPPDGPADGRHTERLIRLPEGFLCFRPPDDAPEVGSLPAGDDGPITFASLNHLAKVTDEAVDAWTELLRRVPQSRLLIKKVQPEIGRAHV